MNKKIKKFLLYLLASFVVSFSTVMFYVFIPDHIESIDKTLRDYMFIVRGEKQDSGNVVIIDIDERSLKNEGQWPWSRNKISLLIEKLTQANVGLVGYDMIFAEEDRTSPKKLIANYPCNEDFNNIEDYDEIFANTILNSPSILGYQFLFNDDVHKNKNGPEIPGIIIEKNKTDGLSMLIKPKDVLLNIPVLQNSAYSSGFVNSIPDTGGVTRSVPLIMQYNDRIYGSLALELIRAAYGAQRLVINYDQLGVSGIQLGELFIPTDRYGRFLVNYRGKQGSFKYISATDVINSKVDPKDIEGKIAIIGTSASGLFDLRSTPFDSIFPGVEIHANVIDNILTQNFIQKPSWVDGMNIVVIITLIVSLTFILAYSPLWFVPLIIIIYFTLSSIALFEALFTYGIIMNIFFVYFSIVTTILITLAINYFLENKQTRLVKGKFANKVSKEVMDDLLSYENDTILKEAQKTVTVFFSDIRGFTSISEQMKNPHDLINYLQLYMDPMSQIIIDEKGTIDKYIGDAIMAYWNAPYSISNHADKALSAAIKQIEYLKVLNEDLKQKNLPPLDMGIGLNTGEAIVGEMGSKLRSDYTIIGDSVNLASRVESLCKQYHAKIIITQYVKESLQEKYIMKTLDLVKVKGKNKPVELFEVFGFGEVEGKLKELLDTYDQALQLYRSSKFKEAKKIFQEILIKDQDNKFEVCKTYIDRCDHLIEVPPKDFDGVFVYTRK